MLEASRVEATLSSPEEFGDKGGSPAAEAARLQRSERLKASFSKLVHDEWAATLLKEDSCVAYPRPPITRPLFCLAALEDCGTLYPLLSQGA